MILKIIQYLMTLWSYETRRLPGLLVYPVNPLLLFLLRSNALNVLAINDVPCRYHVSQAVSAIQWKLNDDFLHQNFEHGTRFTGLYLKHGVQNMRDGGRRINAVTECTAQHHGHGP